MKINNDKAEEQLYKYITSTYSTIKVKSGKCRYNFRCHLNSVHEAKKHNHKKLAMCVCVDSNNSIFIHFINYHKGKFVDHTLGEWGKLETYYFIKWINQDEMWGINNIFINFRRELRNKLSWWVRLTSNFAA